MAKARHSSNEKAIHKSGCLFSGPVRTANLYRQQCAAVSRELSRPSHESVATEQDESYCSKRDFPWSTISKHQASHAPLRIWARLPVGAFGASATVRPRSCSSDLAIAPCHGGAAAHVGAEASLKPQSSSLHQCPVQKSDLEERFMTSFRFMRSSSVSVVWRYSAFAVIMA